jgi:hypothetical protein
VSSCKSEQPNKQVQEKLKTLREENSRLSRENEILKGQLGTPVGQTTPSPTASATASPTQVAFEDIKGAFGEKEITQLAQLGVFDTTTGKFNPQKPITRAEFVRWLVRANNAIFSASPDKLLRLTEAKKSSFSDIPATHPDFRYIQAMADAGFDIRADEKTFKPQQTLTREQMVAMKVTLDRKTAISEDTGNPPGGWTDSDQISKKYWPALYTESIVQGNGNIGRVFGSIKTFKPQAPVTRAEAAVCVSAVGDSAGVFTTAEDALQRRALHALP